MGHILLSYYSNSKNVIFRVYIVVDLYDAVTLVEDLVFLRFANGKSTGLEVNLN